jgi:protein TonB
VNSSDKKSKPIFFHKSTADTSQSDWFIVGLAVSFFLHVLGIIYLESTESNSDKLSSLEKIPVKINFVDKNITKDLVEIKQKETEPPVDTARKGQTNHKTERETKIANQNLSHKKGSKATNGNMKKSSASNRNKIRENLEAMQHALKQPTKRLLTPSKDKSGVKVNKKNPYKEIARNQYEKLLAATYESLSDQTESGYQDFIDDDIAEGDKIDLNTKEYRYIGYFSNLRRSIELVWHYPREAVMRGLEGTVGLQFSINKKGKTSKVKIVKSSGYKELDQAIISAVKLASPFAPLPDGFGREKMTVTGSFSYVLSNWGVAH